jgi:hypothetical protein
MTFGMERVEIDGKSELEDEQLWRSSRVGTEIRRCDAMNQIRECAASELFTAGNARGA